MSFDCLQYGVGQSEDSAEEHQGRSWQYRGRRSPGLPETIYFKGIVFFMYLRQTGHGLGRGRRDLLFGGDHLNYKCQIRN